MSKLAIGVLGAGRIGGIHAKNVACNPRARLAAIADENRVAASRLARSVGSRSAEVDEVLSDKSIDAVLICTPTDTHGDLIERSARAGKAIFCEKPIDLDVKRAGARVRTVESRGMEFMVGFNRRFDPSFAALARRVGMGEVGRPELVTIVSMDPAPPPPGFVERSGGLFLDFTIHDLDMARLVLDEEPSEIFATGSCLIDRAVGEAGDFDTASVIVSTPSGAIAQISNSRRATYGYDQRIEVHGSKGLLAAGNSRATTVTSAGGRGYRCDPALPAFPARYSEAYRAEIDTFVATVLNGRGVSPSGLDGLRAQRLADAATRSAKSGKPIRLTRAA